MPDVAWKAVADELPDAELVVLIATPAHSEPVWMGFLDEDGWYDVSGMPLGDAVTHWADLPPPPL